MCTQKLPNVMQRSESHFDQSCCQPCPAHYKYLDESETSILCVRSQAAPPSNEGVGKKTAVQSGIQPQQGENTRMELVLPQQQKQQKQQKQEPGDDHMQMVAEAVEEARRVGLLPTVLGESHEGETFTMRILQRASASEVLMPTNSTCTHDSFVKESFSTNFHTRQVGEQRNFPCEYWTLDEGPQELVRTDRKKKAPARNKTNVQNHGCSLPCWLNNKSPENDPPVELAAAADRDKSVLTCDTFCERGHAPLHAMQNAQRVQPLNLSILRMKGYNVLAGVSKQHQEKKQDQTCALQSPPGLLPTIPVPCHLMSSPAMNPASSADPIMDSSQIMPPPGLQPSETLKDDTCARFLGHTPESYAAGRADSLQAKVRSHSPSDFEQGELMNKEDVFISNECNHIDECLPLMGSTGTLSAVEFGDEPLKIDLASLQSIQMCGRHEPR